MPLDAGRRDAKVKSEDYQEVARAFAAKATPSSCCHEPCPLLCKTKCHNFSMPLELATTSSFCQRPPAAPLPPQSNSLRLCVPPPHVRLPTSASPRPPPHVRLPTSASPRPPPHVRPMAVALFRLCCSRRHFPTFNRNFSRQHALPLRARMRAFVHRITAALGSWRVTRSGLIQTPALRRFFKRVSEPAAAVPVPGTSAWSVGKQLIIKPFVYASLYSTSSAAITLALLSAPQLAAAPSPAQAALLLVNTASAFAVGSAHGSFNGVHRLLVQERVLVRLLPMGQVFDFLKSKNTQPLDMEVPPPHAVSPAPAAAHSPCTPLALTQASKAVAAKLKTALLAPRFLPRLLRPAAAFIVELIVPVSAICDIPRHVEQVTVTHTAAEQRVKLTACSCSCRTNRSRAWKPSYSHSSWPQACRPSAATQALTHALQSAHYRRSITGADKQERERGHVRLRRSAHRVLPVVGMSGMVLPASALELHLQRNRRCLHSRPRAVGCGAHETRANHYTPACAAAHCAIAPACRRTQ